MSKKKKDNHLLEEIKKQAKKLQKQGEERFAKEALEIQKELLIIQTPLSHLDSVHIYRWLFRKQITLKMIPTDVLKEFKETEQYKIYRKKSQSKDF